MAIFLNDGDYRQFVYMLGEVCEEYAIECWSYCLMPNHYHTALLPDRPNFSAAMQYLNGEYAKWWNGRHGKVGHTFQGRFTAQIVQHDVYLLTLLRYIALNPVRAGLAKDPAAWRWGSYRALAGLEPAPPFLDVPRVLSAFGDGELEVLRERFVKHVIQPPAGVESLEDRLRSNARILGDRAFKDRVRGEPSAEPDSSHP